jgi:hypothetical protein
MPSFGGEIKPSVPCRSFAACKNPLQFLWTSHGRPNLNGHFSPIIPTFADKGLLRRLTWSASVDDRGTKNSAQRACFLRPRCIRAVGPRIRVSVYLSIHSSIHPSIYLSIHPSVRLSYLSIYLSIVQLCTNPVQNIFV